MIALKWVFEYKSNKIYVELLFWKQLNVDKRNQRSK